MTFLYTVVPPEEVWSGEPGADEAAAALVEVTYRGVPLLARRTVQGAVIERLLTTNPYAYLDPGLRPGTLLGGAFPEE